LNRNRQNRKFKTRIYIFQFSQFFQITKDYTMPSLFDLPQAQRNKLADQISAAAEQMKADERRVPARLAANGRATRRNMPSFICTGSARYRSIRQSPRPAPMSSNAPGAWSARCWRSAECGEDHHRDGRPRSGLKSQESRALLIGSAYLAWDDYMAKHESRIREWANVATGL
jgi:hypothetical protein